MIRFLLILFAAIICILLSLSDVFSTAAWQSGWHWFFGACSAYFAASIVPDVAAPQFTVRRQPPA